MSATMNSGPLSAQEHNHFEVKTSSLPHTEHDSCLSSSSPIHRTLTSEPLIEKLTSLAPSSKVEDDKTTLKSPSELDWDMTITPPSLMESEPQTIPVFRQSRGGAKVAVSSYEADPTYANKLIKYQGWGPYQPFCISEPVEFTETAHHGQPTEDSLYSHNLGGEASPLSGVKTSSHSPFVYVDAQLASPTFVDFAKGADPWKSSRGRSHSRQVSSSGPQPTNLGPLYFTSPSSPLLAADRTSGPLQYSLGDYAPVQHHSLNPLPSFGSPTHASVTCSTLCRGGPWRCSVASPCVPPALSKESTFAPPYKHWDDIGYLSLGDRHGGGGVGYFQRLETLMSPLGAAYDNDYVPLTSPTTSDPTLPHVYHSAYTNPMFLLSGAEFLLAPKEAPLAPFQTPPAAVCMDCPSPTSSAAQSSRTQPATITLDLTGYGSPVTLNGSQQKTDKNPISFSRDCQSNESMEGGHTDASSQRSASTPSSSRGADTTAVDSYHAYI